MPFHFNLLYFRWAEVMTKVAQLQLPDEESNKRNSTQSSSSSNGQESSNICDLQSPEIPLAHDGDTHL